MFFNYITKQTKEKTAGIFPKRVHLILILVMVLAGIFFRTYHFSSWLHFELDQARDANVITDAVSGGERELPLLGPRARGTYLRLGPLFYYFGYVSARLFSPDPPGIAASVLIFSILTFPIFYLFFRRYFNRNLSTGLLALFCFSLFLIMYSRFFWNPNLLIFFIPLSLYAVLRATDAQEKNKGHWLAVGFFSTTAATQLHFVAFVVMPLVFFIFLVFKRPQIRLKYWLASIFIALFLYAPVFINEYKTGGDNFKELIGAVNRESKQNNLESKRKIFIDLKEHMSSYALILSGKNDSGFFPINFNRFVDRNTFFPIDYSVSIVSAIFFAMGLILALYKTKKEKDAGKKDFLVLILVFFAVNFFLFFPLATELSPRFFLLTAIIPFVFLGLILEQIPRRFKFLVPLVIIILLLSNSWEIKKRFGELAKAHTQLLKTEYDPILKEKVRVTYFQENLIANYIIGNQAENNFPIFFIAEAEYDPAFEYILEHRGVLFDGFPKKDVYTEGNYFLIEFTRDNHQYDLRKYEKSFTIEKEKEFGTLTVLKMMPKKEAITSQRKNFEDTKKKSKSSAPKRYKWGELFL